MLVTFVRKDVKYVESLWKRKAKVGHAPRRQKWSRKCHDPTTCHNIQGICFQLMGQSSLFRALSTYLAVLSSWRPGAWRLKISMVFTKWVQPSAHTFLKTTERQTPCLKEARSANWALWEGSVLSTNTSKTFHTYSRRKMKFRIANKVKNYQKLSGL